jgi:choline dehydrogenase-like flavoprotein
MEHDGVCVVGSGPTGVMTALTLTEAGVPVLMLESGDGYPRRLHVRIRDVELFRPAPPAVREPVADVDFVCEDTARWIKAHCVGGLSNYWSGITLRFSRGDFADGERLHPMYRWPVGYDDLRPYYERVEKLIYIRGGREDFETLPACTVSRELGVGREWERFRECCREAGRELAALPDAYGPSTVVSNQGTPQNFALRLLGRLKRSSRFQLLTGAHVTRVLIDSGKRIAHAVEYVDTGTGVFGKISARAIVLAAGPLSSTQILLNSRSASFPAGLGNEHGVLGRYLHDHPLEYAQVEGNFRFRRLDDRRRGGLYVTRQGYADSPPLQANAFLLYGGTFLSMTPYLLLLHNRYYFKVIKRMLEARRHSSGEWVSPLTGSLMYVCCFGTQVPCYENHVSLDPDKKDRFGVPLLRLNTRYSDSEMENMRAGTKLIPHILEAAGNRVARVSAELQARGTSVHYGGTARMHESPRYGVVDGWNRLHDVKNLLVVDASCFATCVEKNPSLTAMAIAMRAAERLAAERSV